LVNCLGSDALRRVQELADRVLKDDATFTLRRDDGGARRR
jgi:hypothetical protein